jgi:DNA-binding transcriptional regulator YdaS (Cro superfamily)
LPFSPIKDREFNAAQRREVERLAQFGSFRWDPSGSGWEATAWTGARAIRRVIEGVFNALLLPEAPAQTIPPEHLRGTHRHLEAFSVHAAAAELKQLSDAIARVRSGLSILARRLLGIHVRFAHASRYSRFIINAWNTAAFRLIRTRR